MQDHVVPPPPPPPPQVSNEKSIPNQNKNFESSKRQGKYTYNNI